MRHQDDHVLVIDAHGHASMQCPFETNPERRRGRCGYLEQCGCELDFMRTQEKLAAYFDIDLELYDWLEGFSGSLALAGQGAGLHGDSHQSCPRVPGQQHAVWEGEIMVPGTSCGYQGELEQLGGELFDGFGVEGPGSYVVSGTWAGEDGLELELVERLAEAR